MHYMTAGVLMSLVISNMNSEKLADSQADELNYSVRKTFVSCKDSVKVHKYKS